MTAPLPHEKTQLVKNLTEHRAAIIPDLKLSRIKEDRYSTMGYAIRLEDWDAYVDQLQFIYKLSPEAVAMLKLAKYKSRQPNLRSSFSIDESAAGEVNYLKLVVEHKNGKINLAFAGNRVNFLFAPIKEISTQTWLLFWQTKTVNVHPRSITIEEKQKMEDYFIGRAIESFVTQNGREALQCEKEYNQLY